MLMSWERFFFFSSSLVFKELINKPQAKNKASNPERWTLEAFCFGAYQHLHAN